MAGAYSHYFIAKAAIDRLSLQQKAIILQYPSLYFFGAQGADFCFFYPVFKSFRKVENFGRYLHNRGGYGAFCVCKAFSADEMLHAYTLGYVTHYAADTVFHPFVYAQSGKSPLRHSRVEAALDSYFADKAQPNDPYRKFFGKKPPDAQINELFLLYAAIAAKAGFPPLERQAFFRAVRLFNAYLPLPNAVFCKENKLRERLANTSCEPWKHPQTGVEYTDGANELALRSVRLSAMLIEQFERALKNRTPLPRDLFAKNYLSGL